VELILELNPMSYSDLVNSADFKTELKGLCFVEFYSVLKEAIEQSRLAVIQYLVNEKNLEITVNHLQMALNLPKSLINDTIIKLIRLKVKDDSDLIRIVELSQLNRLIELGAFTDRNGCVTLYLLDKDPEKAKIVSRTMTQASQAVLKQVMKKAYAEGVTEIEDRCKQLIKPVKSKSQKLTVEQLLVFLKKNDMAEHIESLEDALDAYETKC
jgi:hypothetical protein